jgi:hypothetical protein
MNLTVARTQPRTALSFHLRLIRRLTSGSLASRLLVSLFVLMLLTLGSGEFLLQEKGSDKCKLVVRTINSSAFAGDDWDEFVVTVRVLGCTG